MRPHIKNYIQSFADCQNSTNVQRSRSAASEAAKFWQSRQFCLFNNEAVIYSSRVIENCHGK